MKKFCFPALFALLLLFTAYGCEMDHRSKRDQASSTSGQTKILSEIEYLTSSDIDCRSDLRADQNDSTIFTLSGDERECSYTKFTKTGSTSSPSEADGYGINSAITAGSSAYLSVWASLLVTSGDHAHGVFSFGEGTSTIISDCVLITQGTNSRAIVSAQNAVVTAKHVTAETSGENSPALFADRSAQITAERGIFSASGENSPAVFSAADISLSNAKIYSELSNAAVISGSGTLSLSDCDVGSESAPAFSLNGSDSVSLTVSGGEISCGSSSVFQVSGTEAAISLSASTIGNANSDGAFLEAENSVINLQASAQEINGFFTGDSASTINITLTDNSVFNGAVTGQPAKISVTLQDSSWILTEDSQIDSLTCSSNDIQLNGYTLLVNGVAYTVD